MKCPSGSFQNETGKSICLICASGTYSSNEGVSSCVACDAGKKNEIPGQSMCSDCESGKYKNAAGIEACSDCDAGKFTNDETTKFDCFDCKDGKFQELPGQSTCQDCAAGKYSVGPICSDCPIGRYSSVTGSENCKECDGDLQYMNVEGSESCYVCQEHAVATADKSSCLCKANYYAIPFGDALTFQSVDPTLYSNYNDFYVLDSVDKFDPNEDIGFWCATCPTGADCNLVGTSLANVTAEHGYFMGADATGTYFVDCLNDACDGGSCTEGYTGIFCTDCDQGLVLGIDFECTQCVSKGVIVFCIVLGFLFCVGVLIWLVNDLHNDAKKEIHQLTNLKSTYFKIVASAFQVNAAALSFAFKWDESLVGLFRVQSDASSLGTTYVQLSCLFTLESPFFWETFIYLIGPIVFFSFCWLGIFIMDCYHKDRLQTRANPQTGFVDKTADFSKTASVVIMFLLQPTLTQKALQIFSCVELGNRATDWYMVEDLSIQCWTGEHWRYMAWLGIPMIFFYVIGIPAGIYMLLHYNRDFIRETEPHKIRRHSTLKLKVKQRTKRFYKKYGFLYDGI